MSLTGIIKESKCIYNGCEQKAVSVLCAYKDGEDSVYSPACGMHEPDIFEDMKELYIPTGYSITITDIPNGSE